MTTIRLARAEDTAALYDVCIRTADSGADARGVYSSDDLIGDIFVGPYLHLEPELAFVLDDDGRAVGYCLGTADTAAFVRSYRERWLPLVSRRYPEPADPPQTPDDGFVAYLNRPEEMWDAALAEFPAHLHIDLLPDYQGRGYGRLLVETFLAAAAAAGAGAVHLGVLRTNTRAIGFYRRLGFTEIPGTDSERAIVLGRPTRGTLRP